MAIINAVRTLLKTDSGVTALVGQATFDQVPEGTEPPYIYIGPASRTRLPEVDCYQAWALRVRIYSISAGYGRGEDWEITEAVVQALDKQEFALPEPFAQCEPLKITQAGDVIDPNAPVSVFVDITTTIVRAAA